MFGLRWPARGRGEPEGARDAAVVAALQRELLVPPDAAVADTHLEMMSLEYAWNLNDRVARKRAVGRHRRVMFLRTCAAAATLSLTTGLAAANALPTPVQNLVSAAGTMVGIHLPEAPVGKHPGAVTVVAAGAPAMSATSSSAPQSSVPGETSSVTGASSAIAFSAASSTTGLAAAAGTTHAGATGAPAPSSTADATSLAGPATAIATVDGTSPSETASTPVTTVPARRHHLPHKPQRPPGPRRKRTPPPDPGTTTTTTVPTPRPKHPTHKPHKPHKPRKVRVPKVVTTTPTTDAAPVPATVDPTTPST